MRPTAVTKELTSKSGEQTEADTGWVDVPLYAVSVSSGSGRISDRAEIRTHLKFRAESLRRKGLQPSELCCVTNSGDSMSGILEDGDTLMINTANTMPTGDIFVLRIGDLLLAKRLQLQVDGTLQVISQNQIYPVEVISEKSRHDVEILGQVVWAGRWM